MKPHNIFAGRLQLYGRRGTCGIWHINCEDNRRFLTGGAFSFAPLQA
jgi:hypothetical protein